MLRNVMIVMQLKIIPMVPTIPRIDNIGTFVSLTSIAYRLAAKLGPVGFESSGGAVDVGEAWLRDKTFANI